MNMANNAIFYGLPQSCSDLSDLTVACNQENTGRQVTDQLLSIISFLQPLVLPQLEVRTILDSCTTNLGDFQTALIHID